MANWTIVVWAAITPDLREPFEADLKEVAPALATRGPASAPLGQLFSCTWPRHFR